MILCDLTNENLIVNQVLFLLFLSEGKLILIKIKTYDTINKR